MLKMIVPYRLAYEIYTSEARQSGRTTKLLEIAAAYAQRHSVTVQFVCADKSSASEMREYLDKFNWGSRIECVSLHLYNHGSPYLFDHAAMSLLNKKYKLHGCDIPRGASIHSVRKKDIAESTFITL